MRQCSLSCSYRWGLCSDPKAQTPQPDLFLLKDSTEFAASLQKFAIVAIAVETLPSVLIHIRTVQLSLSGFAVQVHILFAIQKPYSIHIQRFPAHQFIGTAIHLLLFKPEAWSLFTLIQYSNTVITFPLRGTQIILHFLERPPDQIWRILGLIVKVLDLL